MHSDFIFKIRKNDVWIVYCISYCIVYCTRAQKFINVVLIL